MGDFSIVDDKLLYETKKGDIIEANLPNDNKSIKNKTKNEEVKDMTDKKEIKKEDMTEDADAGNMEAKYVKLGENYDQPDPEVVEADRKHIDMDDKEKAKKEEGAEAGEMEAETPEAKKSKKKKDKKDDFSSFKEDMIARFEALEKENTKLKGDITEINSEKIAEKEEYQNDLISDMSDKYMVPKAWLMEKAKVHNEDFIQDMYEGLSFAFGTIPGAEVEAYKKEDMATGLLSKVSGLEMM